MTKNHGEVSTVSSPGDNKAFKITSLLRPQSESSKLGNKKDRGAMDDPTKRLHISVAEVGGYSNLPKSAPDGRSRVNPCVQMDSKGVVLRDPELAEILDPIHEVFRKIIRR